MNSIKLLLRVWRRKMVFIFLFQWMQIAINNCIVIIYFLFETMCFGVNKCEIIWNFFKNHIFFNVFLSYLILFSLRLAIYFKKSNNLRILLHAIYFRLILYLNIIWFGGILFVSESDLYLIYRMGSKSIENFWIF